MFHSLRTRIVAVFMGLMLVGFGGMTLLAGRQAAGRPSDSRTGSRYPGSENHHTGEFNQLWTDIEIKIPELSQH